MLECIVLLHFLHVGFHLTFVNHSVLCILHSISGFIQLRIY